MVSKRVCICGRNEYDGSPTYYCFNTGLTTDHRGYYVVEIKQYPNYFCSFFRWGSNRYVFNSDNVCISHPPSIKYRYHEVNAFLKDI